ncbi:phytoene/squalene synthase family protein [Streptomyces sp. BR123]|uniref:phytoene/squalene synthase family protein n=1 Tax=Streptomyces sp. BR123 TaxID=2749828 RepID=UPI0015C4B270|nr:phytoene/squalene synthase family protein [Streptomyces sp. BR123]NXY94034.1 phytoene/squalene synthase family protein [Streptomyces sp. BR123]
MTHRELDAAGITDPELRTAYARCRELNARHGRTYFLATRLLTPDRRPAVHALYGFARRADDIVDGLGSEAGPAERALALDRLEDDLARGLADDAGTEPVVQAVAHTARCHAIEPGLFTDFLASMRSDLTVSSYADYQALRSYMHGSAAVIGLQMLPVLGTVTFREEAAPHAAELGVAFQLTNFLRDVGEDLDRGRVYLPQDLLEAHGVHHDLLRHCRDTGHTDNRVTSALKAFESLTRAAYRRAAPGLAMLHPVSRPCIRTAFVLYGAILDAVAATGYAVLDRRAVVPRRRRALVAADGVLRTAAARTAARRARGGPPAPAARPPLPAEPSGTDGPVRPSSPHREVA